MSRLENEVLKLARRQLELFNVRVNHTIVDKHSSLANLFKSGSRIVILTLTEYVDSCTGEYLGARLREYYATSSVTKSITTVGQIPDHLPARMGAWFGDTKYTVIYNSTSYYLCMQDVGFRLDSGNWVGCGDRDDNHRMDDSIATAVEYIVVDGY